ncbi:MAG TPA: YraN family protein [Candidatus Moranbacteria bacterium]|nr:YraN family protein [Candidatus Moranbacteria bacterium]
MKTARRQFGDLGEKAAATFLKNLGYKIIEFNFQNNSGRMLGEIDIIAKDGREIVFVEVKTRQMEKYANTLPEENITYSKLHKLSRIANAYLRQKGWENEEYRFDAVSVWLDLEGKKAKIKHISHL